MLWQVLDAGHIQEYDEPYILLQNPESLFHKMVLQTGKAEAAYLLQTAKQVCLADNTQVNVLRHGIHLSVCRINLFYITFFTKYTS